jgi:hypothetical protein
MRPGVSAAWGSGATFCQEMRISDEKSLRLLSV